MKRTTALAAAAVLVGLSLPAVAATAWADSDGCDTHVTQVNGRPDSGLHGDWATDDFTRTTEVCGPAEGGVYTLTLTDSGTFTTLSGAKSPGAGVDLPAEPIVGNFSGGATVTVTSDVEPIAPPVESDGTVSSSQWATLLFPSNAGTISDWGWTYTYCDETWVNSEASNEGDVTGAEDCEEEPPTTTVPPTTTTPPPPSSSAPPTSSTGSIPPTTDTTTSPSRGVYYADCDAVKTAGKAPIRPGDAGWREAFDSDNDGVGCEINTATGVKGDWGEKDLAYTGTSASLLWVVLAAVLLLGGGGALLYVTRRRRATGGTHRR